LQYTLTVDSGINFHARTLESKMVEIQVRDDQPLQMNIQVIPAQQPGQQPAK
jgi:hypothetical protein